MGFYRGFFVIVGRVVEYSSGAEWHDEVGRIGKRLIMQSIVAICSSLVALAGALIRIRFC